MRTILFNTRENKPISKIFENGYNMPIPEDYVIEIEVVDTPRPEISETQMAVPHYEFQDNKWVRAWDVVDNPTWLHDYSMRIEVPLSMYFEPQYSIFSGYLVNIQKLPVERVSEDVHIYCNMIEEQFQGLIDGDDRINVTHRDD